MGWIYALLVIILIGSALGLVYVVCFNKLKENDIRIKEAESIIDESLRNKYDLMMRLDLLLQKYFDKDKSYFKELKELKGQEFTSFTLDRKIEEAALIALKVINDEDNILKEADYINISNDIKKADEKLSAAKSFYNKYTTKYNALVNHFPSSIVAKVIHLEEKRYYDGKNLNDDIYEDFKL